MIPGALDGLIWLLACLLPFLMIQRWLHRELQAVFLLITRRPALAMGLFSFVFSLGVLLHETSHYVMARLLRVQTGRFSLTPQMLPNGRLQLGYVETAPVDFFRDALIGMAPLVSGGVVIAYVGIIQFQLLPLATAISTGTWPVIWRAALDLPNQTDFWVWFYIAFAVSSTMLPSASDRRAWLPVVLSIAALSLLAFVAGAGPWMLQNLAPRLDQVLRALALVFGISLLPHIILTIPIWLLRLLMSRVTGLEVV